MVGAAIMERLTSVVTQPEREVTPDVYGSTPFQHEVTSEPCNTMVIVVRPLKAIGSWQRRANSVRRTPAVPAWMNIPKTSR